MRRLNKADATSQLTGIAADIGEAGAVERLVVEKGLTDRETMRERKEAWTEAYLHTPHGKPVELHGGDRQTKHG